MGDLMGCDKLQTRLSIALCTYNGERFLAEQLNSFLVQQRLPDELVVCDDCSTDRTIDILKEFVQRCAFPVRIFENPVRLGVVKNYEQTVSLCDGDIIVVSDQDDVWSPSKLEYVAKAFSVPEVLTMFSDADVVDASLQSVGYTLWESVRFDRDEQACMMAGDAIGVLLKHSVVMGASLAFRSNLRPLLLPIPSEWNHDAWIALLAASTGQIVPLATPLLKYRQHGGNQVGGAKKSLRNQIRSALQIDRTEYYKNEIAKWRLLLDRLVSLRGNAKVKVELKLAHLVARAGLPKSRLHRVPGVMREIISGGYRRYARNWGSIALDLLVK